MAHNCVGVRRAVFVDDQMLNFASGQNAMGQQYTCIEGGTLMLLWQLYRPLLGATVELTSGEALTYTPRHYRGCHRHGKVARKPEILISML